MADRDSKRQREDVVRFAKEAIQWPFPDGDLLAMVDGAATIVSYPDIAKYRTLEELLYPHDAVVILYLQKPDYGHWTLLMRQTAPDGSSFLEWFDPYAWKLDSELDKIDPAFRRASNQDRPWLSMLIAQSQYAAPGGLFYNKVRLQKMARGINTCGRWVALRCALRSWPLPYFLRMFGGKDSDFLATCMTSSTILQSVIPTLFRGSAPGGAIASGGAAAGYSGRLRGRAGGPRRKRGSVVRGTRGSFRR